ncbi:MAG: hypothetical protein M3081_15630, partial [Gemmatimonadota bacterium]|nr:hypothetical protein [Gemmatimonadota bacterium]
LAHSRQPHWNGEIGLAETLSFPRQTANSFVTGVGSNNVPEIALRRFSARPSAIGTGVPR